MITKERHKEVVDQLNEIVDKNGKLIGGKVLSQFSVEQLLRSPSEVKKNIMRVAVLNFKKGFIEVKKVGRSFGEEKLAKA